MRERSEPVPRGGDGANVAKDRGWICPVRQRGEGWRGRVGWNRGRGGQDRGGESSSAHNRLGEFEGIEFRRRFWSRKSLEKAVRK